MERLDPGTGPPPAGIPPSRGSGMAPDAAACSRLGRCLITGATGEIGSYCVRLLNRSGVRPMVLLRRPLAEKAWLGAAVEIVNADLAALAGEAPAGAGQAGGAPAALIEALERTDTLIHLAARVNLSGRGAEEMQRINYAATVALFDLARRSRVRRFVQVSTTGAVGCAGSPTPLTESARYNLERFRNPYFDTKRRAEEVLLTRWRENRDSTELVIVNPPITTGPQGSFRRLARARHRPLPRPGSPWLRCVRFWFAGGVNLVDVRDAAAGILLAALHGRPGQRYILGGENITIRELMRALQRTFGTGAPDIRLPLWLLRVIAAGSAGWARLFRRRPRLSPTFARVLGPYWYYDSSFARRELGYAPRPLEETLRDLHAWWLEQAGPRS
jgi:dihydroflavonol-4-reductase